jgi:tetratricopeptide (TPR) repeat protein
MNFSQWQKLLFWTLSICLVFGCASKQKKAEAEDPKVLAEKTLAQEQVAKEDQAGRYVGEGGFALSEGNEEQALEYFLGATAIYEDIGKVTVERGEAHYLAGETAHKLKKRELAIAEYTKAVDIYLRFSGASKIKGAHALANMGAVHRELEDKDKARNCWERALNIYRAAPAELQNKNNMARIQQNINDLSY